MQVFEQCSYRNRSLTRTCWGIAVRIRVFRNPSQVGIEVAFQFLNLTLPPFSSIYFNIAISMPEFVHFGRRFLFERNCIIDVFVELLLLLKHLSIPQGLRRRKRERHLTHLHSCSTTSIHMPSSTCSYRRWDADHAGHSTYVWRMGELCKILLSQSFSLPLTYVCSYCRMNVHACTIWT